MSVLSIVMLIASIFFLYLVIRNINKNNILFEQAFMWIVISLVLIVIAVFDTIPGYFARLLGFELTSNFLLSITIFFLLVIVFLQTMTLSKQKEQIKHLVQELSILKSHVEMKEENNEQQSHLGDLCLSFVETKYATIAHQDDYYEPEYAEKVLGKMERNSDVLIGYSDYFEEKDGHEIPANTNLKIKTLMLKTMNLFPASHFWRNRVMAFGNPICCPAVTYNRKNLKNFYFDEGMRVSLDWYAWYKISEYKGRFAYVSDKLMCHRIHGESETSKTIADNTRSEEDLFMYELFWPKWMAKLLMRQYVKSQKTNN